MKQCAKCGDTKPRDQFGNCTASKDGKYSYCRDCKKQLDSYRYTHNPAVKGRVYTCRRNRKRRNLQFVFEYLGQHRCVDCGESDPIVLDFDHVRGEKVTEVSIMAKGNYGLKAIKAEIAKCEIRCANCHRRKTARENNWYSILSEPTTQQGV